MFDPRLRLRHLHCFLETARLGSVSAAAAALHVSQPAVSKTLRELEEILGVTLLERQGRRLGLTKPGQIFQQHCGAALVTLGRAQDLAREAPRAERRLLVGALPTAATGLVPRAALAFRAARPDCLLRVSTGPNWLLISQLREGSLDMVVGRMPGTLEGLSFRQLYSEQIVPVLRPGHPLLAEPEPLAALAGYPLILPPPGALIAQTVRAFLHGLGITAPSVAWETVSLAFGRAVTRDSDAVWMISEGVVADELASGALARLPMRDPLLGPPVGVSMRDQTGISPEQSAFLVALTEAARG
ncbi:LysR substrate-binding domain-containing protein [Frigidibacter sp. MR17.24]|uniref:LysR substrate-binding domain-containing protein n=1 Tax=Frigidibacter sp. MR17.24 TaxID=3127345 RepID=UPI003012DD61